MPYHLEHHASPSVPFYKLKETHQLLVDANPDILESGEIHLPPAKGYIRFHYHFLKNLLLRAK